MTSTLKNFLHPLKNLFETTKTLEWYLTSLAAAAPKHTLENASDLSGIDASQFSRLLAGSKVESEVILSNLSRKAQSEFFQRPNPILHPYLENFLFSRKAPRLLRFVSIE